MNRGRTPVRTINRREFLMATPAAAVAMSCVTGAASTSSQQTADMANHIDFADAGRQHYDDKDSPRRVRAVRQI
jgi:hypothetical protein